MSNSITNSYFDLHYLYTGSGIETKRNDSRKSVESVYSNMLKSKKKFEIMFGENNKNVNGYDEYFSNTDNFTKYIEKMIPDIYEAISNGDLSKSSNLIYEYSTVISKTMNEPKTNGDWIWFSSNNEDKFFKGQSLTKWEEKLSIQTDSSTGIKYFELDGYKIPTKEFRGKKYDLCIASLADKMGKSFAEIEKSSIFFESEKRFKEMTMSTNSLKLEDRLKCTGANPFNRILDFVSKYKIDGHKEDLSEKKIKEELKNYIDFEIKYENTTSIEEKKKIFYEDIMRMMDKMIENSKKIKKDMEQKIQHKKEIERMFEKDELVDLLEKLS